MSEPIILATNNITKTSDFIDSSEGYHLNLMTMKEIIEGGLIYEQTNLSQQPIYTLSTL